MTFDQLTYFVKTAEKGSLSKASDELFVSQPALSKQLLRMETELGCSLMIRKTTGIELTDAGRYLYDQAVVILHQMKQCLDGLKPFTVSTPFRIGTLPSLATYYLPYILPTLEQKSNPLPVAISVFNTTRELVEMVETNKLDLAFVQDQSNHSSLHVQYLFEEDYVAVLPNSHPLLKEPVLTFESLVQTSMILPKDPCDIRSSFREHCKKLSLIPNVVLELDYNESMLAFIAQNHGVSVMPRMVAKHANNTGVTIRDIQMNRFTRTISAIYSDHQKQLVKPMLASLDGGRL